MEARGGSPDAQRRLRVQEDLVREAVAALIVLLRRKTEERDLNFRNGSWVILKRWRLYQPKAAKVYTSNLTRTLARLCAQSAGCISGEAAHFVCFIPHLNDLYQSRDERAAVERLLTNKLKIPAGEGRSAQCACRYGVVQYNAPSLFHLEDAGERMHRTTLVIATRLAA